MLQTQVINLSPKIATEFLGQMNVNRPLNRQTVENYAAAIKRGEWKLNGESLSFDESGALVNGQHRCHAVIKAGMPINVLVVRNCEAGSFATFDGGRKRSTADVFAISGEIHTAKLAASAAAIFWYDHPGRAGVAPSREQLLNVLEKYPSLRFWVARFACEKGLRRFPSRFAGLCSLAAERYGHDVMVSFVDKLSLGAGLQPTDPTYLLRERYAERVSNITQSAQNYLFIKAVLAHVNGKKIGVLKYNPSEQTPRF